MSDLRDLYQEIILDHSRHPRNFETMEDPTGSAEGYNPMCGDKIMVYAHIENGVIQRVCFQGHGCAISQASASLMTQQVQGLKVEEADLLETRFNQMVTGKLESPDELDELASLAGVRAYPIRVKCATLAWHALHAAIHEGGIVSTE